MVFVREDVKQFLGMMAAVEGPQMHEIEIDIPNASTDRKVREAVEALAFDLDALVEFEDDEDDEGE